jgi:hypothetical protein
MSGNYLMVVEGLESLGDIESLDADILRNARNAINKAADRTRTASDKAIREDLNFPARYLSQRLTVTERAHGSSLSAKISGRDRPTSLARFASNRNQAPGKAGVRVQVGLAAKMMKRAFLMKLANSNLGLAMRLKEGERIANKKQLVKVGKGLYLLYGPSIDQAFSMVIPGQEAGTAEFLEREFLRLMEL